MASLKTLRLLWQFVTRPIRGDTHAQRLASFYGYQADQYDEFRKSFLRGREEVLARLDFQPGSCWCDLGCGTGYLLAAADPAARVCREIHLVDLCGPLLKIAAAKVQQGNWNNVRLYESDITEYRPAVPIDMVTFSYSLSMTPDWFAAIDRAYEMLKPGGTIAVVDFYVSRKYPVAAGHRRHPFWTRHFWPAWFDVDNVYPSAEHIPYLERKFEVTWFHEGRTQVPGLFWFRPPYYCWIGLKPREAVRGVPA